MGLRELKKEILDLSNIDHSLKRFQEHWIKPIRKNTNQHLPFLQNFSLEERKELNNKLADLQDQLYTLNSGQNINEKLRHYAHYLIELKLTTLNGDKNKAKLITNKFLRDDVLNLQQTITEIKSFEDNLNSALKSYEKINEYLQQKLSLEENLLHTEKPHQAEIQQLLRTAKEQKKMVKKVGEQFVKLTREKKWN